MELKFLKIKNVLGPNNFNYECVNKENAVAIVLFNCDYTKILLVKQFRAGADGKEIYELPAGIIEPDETPNSTMIRETREETGYIEDDIIDIINLGEYYVSPGYTNEKVTLFRARIKQEAKAENLLLDDNENIKTQWINIDDVENITIDMKTQLGVSKALALPKLKIGIYGGSFNPVTNLHLLTIERSFEELDLDKCIIEPVGDKYRKNDLISFDHRSKMLELAIKYNNKIVIGNYETRQFIQPHTIDTLRYYKNLYGWCEIYFICGSDNLNDMVINQWPNYNKILNEFNVICVQRDDDNIYQDIILRDKYAVQFKNHIHVIHENVVNNISSSAIRNLVRAGMSIKHLLPDSVEEYIKENKLYIE